MAEARVGILIEAVDKTTAVLSKIGQVGGGAMKELGKASKLADSGWKDFRQTLMGVNQGLEIVRKVGRLFSEAIFGSVEAAKAFRSENDPAVQQLKSFETTLASVQARIGDVLIPIFQGLADVMGPLIEQFRGWIVENRKVIATGLAEWLAKVGSTMISVVAKGIVLVARTWYGWVEIVSAVKIGVNEFFKLLIQGSVLALKGMSALASATGANGLAATLTEAHNALVPLWEEFDRGSQAAQADLASTAANLDAIETTIGQVETAAQRAFGQVLPAVLARVQSSTVGATKKFADLATAQKAHEKLLTDSIDRLDAKMKLQASLRERVDAGINANAADAQSYRNDLAEKESDYQEMEAKSIADAYGGAAMAIGSAMGTAFAAMRSGAEDAGKQMLKSIVQANLGAVQAYALSAGAAAAFSQAGIPVVGPILAGVAMATITALIMGLMDQMPAFHTGGVVSASAPRLPGMAPNERAVKALVGERFEDPRRPSTGASGGVTINVTNRNTMNQSSAETKRNAAQLSKLIRRQQRLGYT
jgi:hypothetical protein